MGPEDLMIPKVWKKHQQHKKNILNDRLFQPLDKEYELNKLKKYITLVICKLKY